MTSSKLITLTAVLFALACGVVLFLKTDSFREPRAVESTADSDAAAAIARLQEENARLAEEHAALQKTAQSELDRLRAENAQLRKRAALAKPKEERDQLAAAKAGDAGEAKPARRLRVEFGNTKTPDALVNLDLSKISEASRKMNQVGALLRGAEGKKPQMEVWKRTAGEYKRAHRDLGLLAYAMRGQLPTHIEGGESTHPLVTANLVAETLEEQGVPFDEGQASQVVLLGEDYERARQRLEAGYNATTIALRRIVDELALRRDFSKALDSILSTTQLEALGPTEVRYVAHLDFQSVAVALSDVSFALPYGAPDALRASLEDRARRSWGLEDEHLSAVSFALDRWAQAPTAATPVTRGDVKFYELDAAIAAGRAQLEAMETIARILAHEAGIVGALRGHARFAVPRLVPGWTGGGGGK